MPPANCDSPGDAKLREKISRRDFALRASIASALTWFFPLSLLATNKDASLVDEALPGQFQEAPKPKLSAVSLAEAEARVQAILARYPNRLSEEQVRDLRRLSELLQQQLEPLRAYALANADGPALYLKPLVEREKPFPSPKVAPAAAPKKSRN